MECTGIIKSLSKDYDTDNFLLTLLIDKNSFNAAEYEKLKLHQKLKIIISKFSMKRSKDANSYMWVLLQKMAVVLKTDKWTLYLKMLKEYGEFTYIVVKPGVVKAMQQQWRESEVVGEIEVNGVKAVQMLCYFGSSTYDTKQMAHLIDSIVREAQELGIDTISPTELAQMKERWGV